MGQKTTVTRSAVRKPKGRNSSQRPLRLKIDVWLMLITFILIVLGAVILFSASYDVSYFRDAENHSPIFEFRLQAGFLGIGLVGMGLLTWMDYRRWRQFALGGMLVTILALIIVFFTGSAEGENTRNLLGASGQPSEMAKFMIVIYLSVWLYSKREDLKHISLGLFPLGAILGIIGGLIFLQPDFSAGFTILLLGGIMFYLADGEWVQILGLVAITALVGFLVVRLHPTGAERMAYFLSGWKDPLESSHHVQMAVSALARGGWGGVGLGEGTLKYWIVPFPHTDSIFAVIGEEFGLIGTTVVVVLFGLFLWRGLRIAHRAPDGLGTLLAAGITVWITMEAFMNIMALIGLLPFTGNTLPFFSRGGSSLVFTLLGIGIVLNISRLSEERQTEKERSTFSALINLRGRDWRRRVSRPRRS